MIKNNRPINIRHNAIKRSHSAQDDDDRRNVFVFVPRKSFDKKFKYLVRTRFTNGRWFRNNFAPLNDDDDDSDNDVDDDNILSLLVGLSWSSIFRLRCWWFEDWWWSLLFESQLLSFVVAVNRLVNDSSCSFCNRSFSTRLYCIALNADQMRFCSDLFNRLCMINILGLLLKHSPQLIDSIK